MWAKSLSQQGLLDSKLSFKKYVLKYANEFQLGPDDFQELYEYLLEWDILRVCCGMQMSKHWRKQLQMGTELKRGSTKVCRKNIDIGAVERSYLQLNLTSLLKSNLVVTDVLKPSNVDRDLDGTYCERYRSFVKTNPSAGFNVDMNNTSRKFRERRTNNHKKSY
ncbi:unnamed protein product [Bathycoccus prasinos]